MLQALKVFLLNSSVMHCSHIAGQVGRLFDLTFPVEQGALEVENWVSMLISYEFQFSRSLEV